VQGSAFRSWEEGAWIEAGSESRSSSSELEYLTWKPKKLTSFSDTDERRMVSAARPVVSSERVN
jgi:hypothetical protein